MRWVLFTGTWRLTNRNVEDDVRASVGEVLARGDGVLTGGATGVDYFATEEAMRLDPSAKRLLVIIPARLESYARDYHTNWCRAPITAKEIDLLIALLRKIKEKNPEALIEMPYDTITREHYLMRNSEEVARGSALRAFQVNGSRGTEDTVEKAKEAGVPIELHKKYTIKETAI